MIPQKDLQPRPQGVAGADGRPHAGPVGGRPHRQLRVRAGPRGRLLPHPPEAAAAAGTTMTPSTKSPTTPRLPIASKACPWGPLRRPAARAEDLRHPLISCCRGRRLTDPDVPAAVEMTVRGQAGHRPHHAHSRALGLSTDLGQPFGLPTFPQRRRLPGGRGPPPLSCCPAAIAPGGLGGPKFLARRWSHLRG